METLHLGEAALTSMRLVPAAATCICIEINFTSMAAITCTLNASLCDSRRSRDGLASAWLKVTPADCKF